MIKTLGNAKNIFSILLVLLTFPLYLSLYNKFGVQANSFIVLPLIAIAMLQGMKFGTIFGIGISLFISTIRILNHDPDFAVENALVFAIIAGFGGGMFGLLSDQRKALKESEEELSQKVAEQTIDLQRLLKELELAYETTLEGWAQALELRDKETEGHSRRVTELSMTIGRNLGLDKEEIRYLCYGALLHDIGKMGIPDEILNKPGPLTSEEREIIKQHPGYAYDMLKNIEYLQSAISIPYSHHENWDGTGYPQGLQGEGIPLSARIFSIVDNWDALTSDRPYRKAWSRKKTTNYIREKSGKMFDPQIIDLFFDYLNITA